MMDRKVLGSYCDDMAPYIAGIVKGDMLVLEGVRYRYTGSKTISSGVRRVYMDFVIVNE